MLYLVQISGSQSGRNRLPGGDFRGQGGEKTKGGNGGKNNKGVKMLDH